MVVIVNIIT